VGWGPRPHQRLGRVQPLLHSQLTTGTRLLCDDRLPVLERPDGINRDLRAKTALGLVSPASVVQTAVASGQCPP
jgi:hypothetical protein